MVHKKGSVNMKKRIQKIMLAFALSVTMIAGINISQSSATLKQQKSKPQQFQNIQERFMQHRTKTDLSFQKHNLRTENPMKNMGNSISMGDVQQPLPTLAGI